MWPSQDIKCKDEQGKLHPWSQSINQSVVTYRWYRARCGRCWPGSPGCAPGSGTSPWSCGSPWWCWPGCWCPVPWCPWCCTAGTYAPTCRWRAPCHSQGRSASTSDGSPWERSHSGQCTALSLALQEKDENSTARLKSVRFGTHSNRICFITTWNSYNSTVQALAFFRMF